MNVEATTKYVRISAEKARHVARLLQGKSVAEAEAICRLSPRKAAVHFAKTLKSAVANAENNCDLDRNELTVKTAVVGEGPTLKRFRARARGSASRINKRTSHFQIVLTDD